MEGCPFFVSQIHLLQLCSNCTWGNAHATDGPFEEVGVEQQLLQCYTRWC